MNDLRRLILDTSVDMIAEEGVRELSFREVSRRAKVSHQAPYYHFENYHSILRAIAEEGFLRLAESMQNAADEFPKDPLKALNACGIAYVQFATENLGHFRVMFQSTLLKKAGLPDQLPESQKAHGVLTNLAKANVEAGIAKKLGHESLAMLCWSTVHGIATLLNEGTIPAEKKADREMITKMVVEGLSSFLRLSTK